MTRVSAANNTVIEIDQSYWRILTTPEFIGATQEETLVLEATFNAGIIRYSSDFASSRHLPKDGTLAVQHIQRVVLGWNLEDKTWHLGLVLDNPLATIRNNRWCELLHWPDPDQHVFKSLALDVGQSLARILECPFNLMIQGQLDTASATPSLPSLPIHIQGWVFKETDESFMVLERTPHWVNNNIHKFFWYSIWAMTYSILSAATLTSNIAQPSPFYLPHIGIVIALLFIVLAVATVYTLRRTPRCLILDTSLKQIYGTQSNRNNPLWSLQRHQIDSVYVSQVVIKSPKGNTQLIHSALNLRLTNGHYHNLFSIDHPDPLDCHIQDYATVTPLSAEIVETHLQGIGVYIGDIFQVPVWYDHRIKTRFWSQMPWISSQE